MDMQGDRNRSQRHDAQAPVHPAPWILLAMTWLALAAPAPAQTVYRCTGAQGQLSFQDAPCAKNTRQKVLHLHVAQPSPPPPALQSQPAAPASSTPPVRAKTPTVTRSYRVPQLYRCIRATDGKRYISRNGHPRPYLAPLGILGAFQLPLSQTYGGKDAARRAASDPQLAHGRITQGLVAGHYTWVQDRCRPMRVAAICSYLNDQLDKTSQAIDRAFRSDRPPLERRAAKLREESAGCRARY